MSFFNNGLGKSTNMNPQKSRAFYISVFFAWMLIMHFADSRAVASGPIKVVTTLPVLKDLTENIGGDQVTVKSLLTGFESPHTYAPKPSDLAAVQVTRLFVEIGSGLEVWADRLLKNAQPSDLSVVTTSKNIRLIEDRVPHTRSDAAHQESSNPHIWLDPRNVKTMIREITKGLSHISPENGQFFQSNQDDYFRKLDALEQDIFKMFEGISNKTFISHHPAWPYFAKRFGLTIAGDIQTQLGSEPSAKHMASLVAMIRREGIKVIVSEPQLNPKIPQMLSLETGARLVTLTAIPGAIPGTENYLSMMRYNGARLSDALKSGVQRPSNGN